MATESYNGRNSRAPESLNHGLNSQSKQKIPIGQPHPQARKQGLAILKYHMAHQMAFSRYTKSQLKQRLVDLGHLPQGNLTKAQEGVYMEAFDAVLKKSARSNGWFELKDELWGQLDIGKYPWANEAEKEKAKSRRSKIAPHLESEGSESEDSDVLTRSIPRYDLKRSSSALSESPTRKRAKQLESNRNTIIQPRPAGHLQGKPSAIVRESPKKLKDTKTKFCIACDISKPYNSNFFQFKQSKDGRRWVACLACLRREANVDSMVSVDMQEQGERTVVSAATYAPNKSMLDDMQTDSFTNSNAQTNENPASKCIDQLSSITNSMYQENVRLMKEFKKARTSGKKSEGDIFWQSNGSLEISSNGGTSEVALLMQRISDLENENRRLKNDALEQRTELQRIQSINESLEAEVESMTEDKLNADAEIEGLRTIERRYNQLTSYDA